MRTVIMPLAPEHFNSIRSLTKRTTIRKGYRDVRPGPLVFETPDNTPEEQKDSVEVNVERVIYTRAGEMTDKEARQDGFKDLDDMLEGMKRYYPDFGMNTEVTIIHFWLEG